MSEVSIETGVQFISNEAIWVFNLLSGDIYESDESDIKHLERHNFILRRNPTETCKKCYDRRYIGRDANRYCVPCARCMRKHLDLPRSLKLHARIEEEEHSKQNTPSVESALETSK